MLRIAGRIAIALALAAMIFLGPSHISNAAPDIENPASAAQHHHDGHADAGHDAPSAPDKVYCNALTPGHASHAQHGDDICESHRTMSSTLAGTDFDLVRDYVRLGENISPDSQPPSHSPESLKEPPRTA